MPRIFTIPKAGTTFIRSFVKELNIPVVAGHNTPPLNTIGNRNVVIIRDLKDVMCSVPFWIDKLAKGVIKNHPYSHHPLSPSYLKLTEKEKLLQCISKIGLPKETMEITQSCSRFVVEVMKRKDTLVVHFEDIIGESAGGNLPDAERIDLLQKMCSHLGHPRSKEQIQNTLQKLWGQTSTFNPVEKKVRRWEALFGDTHKEVFIKIWDKLNVKLGYPSLINYKSDLETA